MDFRCHSRSGRADAFMQQLYPDTQTENIRLCSHFRKNTKPHGNFYNMFDRRKEKKKEKKEGKINMHCTQEKLDYFPVKCRYIPGPLSSNKILCIDALSVSGLIFFLMQTILRILRVGCFFLLFLFCFSYAYAHRVSVSVCDRL